MRWAAADGAAGSVGDGIAVISAWRWSDKAIHPTFSPALVDSNISTLSWIERRGDQQTRHKTGRDFCASALRCCATDQVVFVHSATNVYGCCSPPRSGGSSIRFCGWRCLGARVRCRAQNRTSCSATGQGDPRNLCSTWPSYFLPSCCGCAFVRSRPSRSRSVFAAGLAGLGRNARSGELARRPAVVLQQRSAVRSRAAS
jgi:hypothetical protein